jgi:omega-amidase
MKNPRMGKEKIKKKKREKEISVAAIQVKVNPKSSEEVVIQRALTLVKEAAERGASLVCLPEHWLFEKILLVDKDFDNQVYSKFSTLAKKYGININLGGIYERSLFNNNSFSPPACYFVSPMIGPDGRMIGKQRKVHLMPKEKRIAKPGSSFEPIVIPLNRTQNIKVGILVCHDVVFPESARTLVLKGAEILLCPSLILESGILPWHLYCEARALENRVPIIAPNAVFPPRFRGHSIMVDFRYLQKENIVLPVTHIPKREDTPIFIRKIKTNGFLERLRSERFEERITSAYYV